MGQATQAMVQVTLPGKSNSGNEEGSSGNGTGHCNFLRCRQNCSMSLLDLVSGWQCWGQERLNNEKSFSKNEKDDFQPVLSNFSWQSTASFIFISVAFSTTTNDLRNIFQILKLISSGDSLPTLAGSPFGKPRTSTILASCCPQVLLSTLLQAYPWQRLSTRRKREDPHFKGMPPGKTASVPEDWHLPDADLTLPKMKLIGDIF